MAAVPQESVAVRLAAEQSAGGEASSGHPGPALQVRSRVFKAIATSDLALDEIRSAVAMPEARLHDANAVVIKQGRSALIVKTAFRMNDGQRSAAYKRLGSRNWMRRFLRSLQTSAAIHNFRLGHELLRFGVATPRPLLAVSPRWRGWLRPAYLATEWVEDALTIDVFCEATGRLSTQRQRSMLRETAECVGRLVGRLHASGFSHRDLKATNLLVGERDGRIEACIIDLDGAAKPWRLSKRRRLANLARLAIASLELTGVTQTMRLRMLRAYLSNFPEGPAAKAVWSELREVFRIRLARKRRAARR